MGLFDKFLGKSKPTPQPCTSIPQQPAQPASPAPDNFDGLTLEQIAHGGKRLSRKYWGSIYLGAYAPQVEMAVFKGTRIEAGDAERLVRTLHELFGPDDVGNEEWTEEDASDLAGDNLLRSWTVQPGDVHVDLNVDNFHPSDDPVMLSIRPWKMFRSILHEKRKGNL
jgi:hypothetical protein